MIGFRIEHLGRHRNETQLVGIGIVLGLAKSVADILQTRGNRDAALSRGNAPYLMWIGALTVGYYRSGACHIWEISLPGKTVTAT